jgi:iron complex transport system substrate-binding protein
MRSLFSKLFILAVVGIAIIMGVVGCGSAEPTATQLTEATATAQPSNGQSTDTTVLTQTSTAQAANRTITNLDGSTIEVPAEAKRVACLFGPSYEKVVLLGGEDRIIADGDYHINGWPWSNVIYKRLNEVPGVPNAHTDLNLEELVKMQPDLVFYFDKPAIVEQMQALGLCVVPYKSSVAGQAKLSDTRDILSVYAQALGDATAIQRAADYAKYFDEKLAMITAITSTIPESERPTVYFANQDLLNASGKASDRPEVIDLAGGRAVAKDLEGSATEVTMEQLLQWDPDFIIIDHAGSSGNASAEEVIGGLSTDARLKDITAVKNGQVKISPTGVFFWDSGQQKILQLMWMAKTFHPDKFADLDMKAELKDFYSRFFDYQLTDEQAEKILLHENP